MECRECGSDGDGLVCQGCIALDQACSVLSWSAYRTGGGPTVTCCGCGYVSRRCRDADTMLELYDRGWRGRLRGGVTCHRCSS